MSEKIGQNPFILTREEASAVMGLDMGVNITPHMQKVIDAVEKKAKEVGMNGFQVISTAALTEGVLVGMSFDENFFKTPEQIELRLPEVLPNELKGKKVGKLLFPLNYSKKHQRKMSEARLPQETEVAGE